MEEEALGWEPCPEGAWLGPLHPAEAKKMPLKGRWEPPGARLQQGWRQKRRGHKLGQHVRVRPPWLSSHQTEQNLQRSGKSGVTQKEDMTTKELCAPECKSQRDDFLNAGIRCPLVHSPVSRSWGLGFKADSVQRYEPG